MFKNLVVKNFWFSFGSLHVCLGFHFLPRFSVSFSAYRMPKGWG